MTRIKAIILALLIEYHWWYIKRGRKQFEILYNAGFALNSPQILELNTQVSTHALCVMIYQRIYREKYSETIGGVLF